MTSIYLGLRYLFKKRLSYLAMVGVALSVGTLIVVMGVMRGFEKELRAVIRGYLSDIRVEAPGITGMSDWRTVRSQAMEGPYVEAVAPFIESKAILRIRHVGHTWMVGIRGMDPELEPGVSEFGEHYLPQGTLDLLNRVYLDQNDAEVPSVLIGSVMAREFLQLRPEVVNVLPERVVTDEEKIVLMTASEDAERKVRGFVVAGVFHTGRYDYDSSVVLMSLESAKDFMGSGGNVSGINIKLTDYRYAPESQLRLAQSPPYARPGGSSLEDFAPEQRLRFYESGFFSSTWEDQQRSFLEAVQMERVLMAIVLSFVGMLAGFCIFAILITSVYEKRHDIGTLKAVGYTSRSIAVIFMVTGGAIGLIGTLLGIAGGFGFLARINEIAGRIEALTGYNPFPGDVYYFTEIPADLSLVTPIITGLAALCLSLTFSILPALKAAGMDPVETLRWE